MTNKYSSNVGSIIAYYNHVHVIEHYNLWFIIVLVDIFVTYNANMGYHVSCINVYES